MNTEQERENFLLPKYLIDELNNDNSELENCCGFQFYQKVKEKKNEKFSNQQFKKVESTSNENSFTSYEGN